MVDLGVEIGGVKFKTHRRMGSATPTMDAIRMKHGIDGGAGGIIAKSLFGEGGRLEGIFPVLASNWSITGSIPAIPANSRTPLPFVLWRSVLILITPPTWMTSTGLRT